ncbi:unknown [Bacteroides sp. CAG:927]|nr:unknown [Bacteroides sp. CAG:927]
MNRKVVGSVTEEEKTQFKDSLSVGTASMNLRKFSQKTMLNYMSVL